MITKEVNKRAFSSGIRNSSDARQISGVSNVSLNDFKLDWPKSPTVIRVDFNGGWISKSRSCLYKGSHQNNSDKYFEMSTACPENSLPTAQTLQPVAGDFRNDLILIKRKKDQTRLYRLPKFSANGRAVRPLRSYALRDLDAFGDWTELYLDEEGGLYVVRALDDYIYFQPRDESEFRPRGAHQIGNYLEYRAERLSEKSARRMKHYFASNDLPELGQDRYDLTRAVSPLERNKLIALTPKAMSPGAYHQLIIYSNHARQFLFRENDPTAKNNLLIWEIDFIESYYTIPLQRAWLALWPFAVVLDVVTFPVQVAIMYSTLSELDRRPPPN